MNIHEDITSILLRVSNFNKSLRQDDHSWNNEVPFFRFTKLTARDAENTDAQ